MNINVLKENFLMSTSKGVYLIRNKQNGLLKIGRTNNIERRYGEIIKNFEFCGMSASNIILEKFIECSEEVRLERELHKEARLPGPSQSQEVWGWKGRKVASGASGSRGSQGRDT